MSFTFIEPDTPPSSGELEDYIYQEFLRIADAMNQNFEEIETRLSGLETRVTALENP